MTNLISLAKVFYLSTRRFFIEKYTYQVSALAFTTLLSLVPLLSISVFFASIFPEFTNIISIFESYIYKYFVPVVANTIQVYFKMFIQQTLHLPTLSILFLFVTVLLMMNTIDETINDIWHVKRRKGIVWLFYAVILLVAPILIGLSVFLTSYFFSFYLFSGITSFLFFVLPILINTIIFGLFYLYVPNTYIKREDGMLGGFIVALFIELARLFFAMYISYFSNYELIYGVFAIVPIFLIWLYVCWFIILWGAVFTHTLSHIGMNE